MENFEKMTKRKAQLDGVPDLTRREKLNKPARSNKKRYQGSEYMKGGSWYEGEE